MGVPPASATARFFGKPVSLAAALEPLFWIAALIQADELFIGFGQIDDAFDKAQNRRNAEKTTAKEQRENIDQTGCGHTQNELVNT